MLRADVEGSNGSADDVLYHSLLLPVLFRIDIGDMGDLKLMGLFKKVGLITGGDNGGTGLRLI